MIEKTPKALLIAEIMGTQERILGAAVPEYQGRLESMPYAQLLQAAEFARSAISLRLTNQAYDDYQRQRRRPKGSPDSGIPPVS